MGVDEQSLSMARLALDEAIRSLGRQSDMIHRLRARALAFVGTSMTASTFLIGIAINAEQRGARFYVPLACGCVAFVGIVYLFWTVHRPVKWLQRIRASILIEDYAEGDLLDNFLHLATLYDDAIDKNQDQIDALARKANWLAFACVAMVTIWIMMAWLVAS